jgi:hypothetical protein
MIRVGVLVALAACGGGSSTETGGPELTPGVAYALHGVAPDCVRNRDRAGVVWMCSGRPGTIVITATAEQRILALQIHLKSMTLPQAKAHLVPALTPVIDQAGTDALAAQLDKMRSGDTAQLKLAGATIDVVAAGTSKIAPEYRVDLRW